MSFKFSTFACVGDVSEVERDGIIIRARIVHDDEASIDDDDMHNLDQSVTGCNNAQQKDLVDARIAFEHGEWFYGGVVIDLERDGWIKPRVASLWAIEVNYPGSDNSHLAEVAEELAQEALAEESK